MRTSRVSRETAHLVKALSPKKATTAVRRSLRGFANAAAEATSNVSDTELSDPPASPELDRAARNGSIRKRKREKLASSIETRRSPRKAPKLEDGVEKKPRRQPAKKIKNENGEIVGVSPPTNWEEVYNITAEMRKTRLAPVDTMGCESLAEETRSPRDRRLQTLIALMLSSQTKDTVTAVAMKNLQDGLEGGFNLEALLAVEPYPTLNSMINKVGFHNNKTKFIKQVAEILRDKFNGDIPDTIEGLVSLPGVGPKMAYLCMSSAWGRDEGIGVDVHVHRITNLWGWHKTSTPEQTREALESWLPKEKWHDINHLLVGFGQTFCPPVGRDCSQCELGVKKLCPGRTSGSPKKKKVKQEIEIKVEGNDVVKQEETIVEADDAGATVKIKSEDVGEVETSARIPDIEDIA
ncbi:hypothetical protein AC578_9306 [Pseudocercospora eumusae]|uniref:Endonuclease III homolog n=1 Tax=Pseudocercospora eumusae TaxID=321146 RepID=A0A139HN93_9PEZI|nr:hypothetical protein AC578_9306 [Pseudocercospora eumusae]